MKDYSIPANVKITEEELDNIVDAAVVACGYWCDLLEYGKKPTSEVTAMSEALSHGGTLLFNIDEPFEKGGAKIFELTTEKLLKGLAEYGQYDWDNFDGEMSDAAVQQALFGEVIYG